MSTQFELAPRNGCIDWGFAFAFSAVPSAVLFLTLHWFDTSLGLSLSVSLAAFVVSALMSLASARPKPGTATITDDQLLLECGCVRVRLNLDEIAAANPEPSGSASSVEFDAVTDARRAVVVKRRGGGTLRLSPLDPETFLQTLTAAQHP